MLHSGHHQRLQGRLPGSSDHVRPQSHEKLQLSEAMRKISPFLANTGMLLFWRAVLQPGAGRPIFWYTVLGSSHGKSITPTPGLGEAMFVWMSKDEEGPRFSPQLMGLADCFGQAGFLLGVVVYNRFLRTWKYRTSAERKGTVHWKDQCFENESHEVRATRHLQGHPKLPWFQSF